MKKIIVASAILVFIIAFYCGTFSFIQPLPQPSGNYKLGITTKEIKNQSNTILAHMIYPAQVADEKPMSYLGKKFAILREVFAKHNHIPHWVMKLMLPQPTTHLYEHAPLAHVQEKYPVILFSHGLLGTSSLTYLSILEEIASHGYIVCAIDHPNYYVPESLKLSEQFMRMTPQEQKDFQTSAIELYKNNNARVITVLEQINQNPLSIFYHKLDLDRIIVMGHSAGGTAAIEFCRNNKQCKAAINLDGWYDHIIKPEPLDVPLLLMFGEKSIEVTEPTQEYLQRKQLTREQYCDREKAIMQHRAALCASPLCTLKVIEGASHGDFGDSILFKWPLRSWQAAPRYQTLTKINATIIEFLSRVFHERKTSTP